MFQLKKLIISQNKQCVGHTSYVPHMELFDLTNVIKINYLEMTDYDYDVTFDDVTILK